MTEHQVRKATEFTV